MGSGWPNKYKLTAESHRMSWEMEESLLVSKIRTIPETLNTYVPPRVLGGTVQVKVLPVVSRMRIPLPLSLSDYCKAPKRSQA